MDRVLIAFDQIQLANHLEMTLRKVGFDVETITTEFNLSEKLLTFNPDIIIARGQSTKLSTFNIAKKLKDNLKYNGKVILVFGQDQKISPDELSKIRTDLLLFEPMGALKLTMSILNLDPERKELMQDRLLRMAEIDPTFRAQEQSYLVSHGLDLDRELTRVQGKVETEDAELLISDEAFEDFASSQKVTSKNDQPPSAANIGKIQESKSQSAIVSDLDISEEFKNSIKNELTSSNDELSLRIDTYNHQIKKIDLNLQKSLNKRQTKAIVKKQRAELLVESDQKKLDDLDADKRKFANALFKKK